MSWLTWPVVAVECIFYGGIAITLIKTWRERRAWNHMHPSRREIRRLFTIWRAAEDDYLQQVQLWIEGRRSVDGLQDLRESVYEFWAVVNTLMKGQAI